MSDKKTCEVPVELVRRHLSGLEQIPFPSDDILEEIKILRACLPKPRKVVRECFVSPDMFSGLWIGRALWPDGDFDRVRVLVTIEEIPGVTPLLKAAEVAA